MHRAMHRASTFACLALLTAAPALTQLGERPGTSRDTSRGPKDLSGYSVKTPRTRLIHTTDPGLEGGSMGLQTYDPYLAFKLGKELTQREMRLRDGVFSDRIAGFERLLPDGETPMIVGNDQVSCGGCHNMPYADGGAGTNFAKGSGPGRNTPHLYGAGIQGLLAYQIRQKMLQQIDDNRNDRVDAAEYDADRILVQPTPGAPGIDYGASGDLNGDGQPDLNNIFRVWFLDAEGRVLPDATGLDDAGVAGYDFLMEVHGWGESRFGLNPTNRIFAWDAFNAHFGLEAHDPTTALDPDGDGWSQVSNAGLPQSPMGHVPPDPGLFLNGVGLSLDDPDADGSIAEITEGDLDMVEWYLLNSPRPAVGRQNALTRNGGQVFARLGCGRCHVSEWLIEAADPFDADIHRRYLGDLRFFDLDVRFDEAAGRLEGELVPLATQEVDGRWVRHRESFLVPGIFTDFKHHEMGPDLADLQYDGTFVTAFRTTPLWGNGTTGFPWGHDGRSLTLDDVIRRHGGEALAERQAYEAAPIRDQLSLVAYLSSLTLYPTEWVPADVDGDGVISESFFVAGRDTGVERFNPEWLFRIPGEIEGPTTNPAGIPIRSDALVNVEAAYGLDLPYRVDADLDGFADEQDACPGLTGYADGCRD